MKKILALVLFLGSFLFISVPGTTALEDANPPELVDFSITPSRVNTADEDQQITVTVTATDDLTGIGDIQVSFVPLIGTQGIGAGYIDDPELGVDGEFDLISGDCFNGTYRAVLTMPKWSKSGIWELESIGLGDKIGNGIGYDAASLSEMFPNKEGLTIANTTEETTVSIDGDWTFSSDDTSVTFYEGTKVTRKNGGKFAFYKMVNQEYNIEELTEKGLNDDPVYALRIGIPGLDLNFSKNVSVTIKLGWEYNGQRLLIQSLDEGGESWSNETTCVANGTWVGPLEDDPNNYSECTFTVDHASYFAAVHSPVNNIITSPGFGGGPQIRLFNYYGDAVSTAPPYMQLGGFFSFDQNFRGGAHVAACDVDGDGIDEIISATGPGQAPWVKVFDREGHETVQFKAYADNITGGVYIACGDLDGDGKGEIVTGVPEGFGPHVRVFDGETGEVDVTAGFFAYASNLRTGIRVATGDLDNDGTDEIICGTGTGAGTHVRTFTGTGEMIFTPGFFVGSETERTGIKVAAGDINGDGRDEIITASGPGKVPPEITVYNRYGVESFSFTPYATTFSGGIKVVSGDIDGDGMDEIITGVEEGGGPHVRVFSGSGDFIDQFFAYDENFRGGVDVAVGAFAY